jgi:recombination protein RecA
MRLEYAQISQIKGEVKDPLTGLKKPETVASNVKVKVVKNKVAPPFKEAVVRVRFGKGFDDMFTVKNVLAANKKITTGAYLYFDKAPELIHEDMEVSKDGKPYLHGESAFMEFADTHPEWRQSALSVARELITASAAKQTVVVSDDDDEEGSSLPSLI